MEIQEASVLLKLTSHLLVFSFHPLQHQETALILGTVERQIKNKKIVGSQGFNLGETVVNLGFPWASRLTLYLSVKRNGRFMEYLFC